MARKLSYIFIFLFIVVFVFPSVSLAAFLKFDNQTLNVNSGETFQVQVQIDTEGEEAVSSDVYISYDDSILDAVSVEQGTFFDTVIYELLSGTVYIAGMSDDVGVGKTGTGTIATVTFKATGSGDTTLTFICDPNNPQSSKIIKVGINAENIINCSSNQSITVSISGGSTNNQNTSDNSSSETTETSSTTSTTTSTTQSTNQPSELPKAGIFDYALNYGLWGGALIVLGVFLKVMLL